MPVPRAKAGRSKALSILEICRYLQHTEWATALRQADLAFPLIEGAHILALSLSVGLVFMLDLRLLRLGFQSEPATKIMHQVMQLALPGFAVIFVTGLLLFFAQAESVYTNGYFRAKIVMLALAGINAAWYQYKYYPRMAEWDTAEEVPAGPRIVAALSLAFWIGIIACGRLTAYEL